MNEMNTFISHIEVKRGTGGLENISMTLLTLHSEILLTEN